MTRDFELGVELIQHSPCDFEAIANGYDTEEHRNAVESLESVAFAAIWRAAYMDYRYGSGCGDQGHESAVKNANKVLAKTRKAMGYHVTHPVRV